MSDKFSGIRDLLALRQNRRQSNLDRLSTGLRGISNKMFQSREAEEQREFEGAESAAERELRESLQESEFEFRGEEAEEAREFTASESRLGRDFQANQAELDRQYNRASQLIDNEAAMDRLETQIQAGMDELERRNNMAREDYDGPQTWTDQVTGKTYTWQTNQEFDLVKQQMQSDRLAHEIRLRADLGDAGGAGQQIREAYEFAKSEILWDPATQTFRDLSGLSDDELRQVFESAIFTGGFDSLDENSVDRAYTLFTAFMNQMQQGEEPPGFSSETESGPWRPFADIWNTVERAIGGTPEVPDMPDYGAPLLTFTGPEVGPRRSEVEPGAQSEADEARAIRTLRQLIANASPGQVRSIAAPINAMINSLSEDGQVSPEEWQSIQDFIDRATR